MTCELSIQVKEMCLLFISPPLPFNLLLFDLTLMC